MTDEKTEPKLKTVLNQMPNIHQRIQAVKKEVKYVRKTGEAKAAGQKYMVVTHDEVTGLLHEPLAKHGINIIPYPKEDGINVEGVGQSQSGATKWRFSALFIVEFISVDNPKDKIEVPVYMHADDFGDKSPGKALSMAVKTAKLKVFDLESGENEEERVEDTGSGPARRINAEEAQQLRDLIEKAPSVTEENFVEYIKTQPMMTGFEKIEDLYLGTWKQWVAYLEKRIEQAEKPSDA